MLRDSSSTDWYTSSWVDSAASTAYSPRMQNISTKHLAVGNYTVTINLVEVGNDLDAVAGVLRARTLESGETLRELTISGDVPGVVGPDRQPFWVVWARDHRRGGLVLMWALSVYDRGILIQDDARVLVPAALERAYIDAGVDPLDVEEYAAKRRRVEEVPVVNPEWAQ